MFLDTFMDDASEGIMENPVPELEDLQLECAVSLEAAYSDLMLEGCQLKYQEIAEGLSVSAINEGVIEAIKNFFKKLFNAIKKFFGISSSDSSSGGGSISHNTAILKKQLEDKRVAEGLKYLGSHLELLNGEEFKFPDDNGLIEISDQEINNGLKAAMDYAQFAIKTGSKRCKTNNADGEKSTNTLDSDKIALDALNDFIKVVFKRHSTITSAKINSLSDFKNTLDGYTKMLAPNQPCTDVNQNNYRKMLDDMDECYQNMQKYKKVVIRLMERFQKKVINEMPQEYSAIGCKVAKTLANAVMIFYSYELRITKRICEVFRRVIELAMKVSTKTN